MRSEEIIEKRDDKPTANGISTVPKPTYLRPQIICIVKNTAL